MLALNFHINTLNLENKNLSFYDTIDVMSPASGTVLGYIPSISENQVQNVIQYSYKKFQSWGQYSYKRKSEFMHNWHDKILQNQEKLAFIISSETGKTISDSIAETQYAASFVKYYAEEISRLHGFNVHDQNYHGQVLYQPIGVCGIITPWNFPAAMITKKIAPAIIAGNTVILKPSEQAPYSSFALMELFYRSGFPEGIWQTITGDAEMISNEFMSSDIIRKISFTGSVKHGKSLIRKQQNALKSISLELGGNAPFIVCEDADIDLAIDHLLKAKLRNNGQACVAPNRIFLDTKIAKIFSNKLIEKLSHLKFGDIFDPNTDLGTVISPKAAYRLSNIMRNAVANSGNLIYKKTIENVNSNGYYFPTMVIDGVNPKMTAFREEIFGPIFALCKFDSNDDIVKLANQCDYGLAAYVFTNSLSKIQNFVQNLEFGIIAINDSVFTNPMIPFGGIKDSGLGKEGSQEGLKDYMIQKYVGFSQNS